ncbi:MAG: OmpA family protein [Leptospiraceae bacterium]|nr:OmpA family protein [Leptospiraceae bacterium]
MDNIYSAIQSRFPGKIALPLIGLLSLCFWGSCAIDTQSVKEFITDCPPYQRDVAFPTFKADTQTANVTPIEEEEEVEPDYLDKMYNEVKEDFEEAGIELEEISTGFQAVGIKLERIGADGRPINKDESDEQAKQLKVSLDGDLAFDSGSAKLTPKAKELVGKMGAGMNKYPDTVAKIEGHTDSDGAAAANQKLSERRAQSVKTELITVHKIAANRIIQAVGYGEERLLVNPERSAADKAKNRRVEIYLVPQKTTLQLMEINPGPELAYRSACP